MYACCHGERIHGMTSIPKDVKSLPTTPYDSGIAARLSTTGQDVDFHGASHQLFKGIAKNNDFNLSESLISQCIHTHEQYSVSTHVLITYCGCLISKQL